MYIFLFYVLGSTCVFFNTSELRKRALFFKIFFLSNKKIIFSVKIEEKNHNKYYVIFKIQNSNFRTLACMYYQEHNINNFEKL